MPGEESLEEVEATSKNKQRVRTWHVGTDCIHEYPWTGSMSDFYGRRDVGSFGNLWNQMCKKLTLTFKKSF